MTATIHGFLAQAMTQTVVGTLPSEKPDDLVRPADCLAALDSDRARVESARPRIPADKGAQDG